MGFVIEGFIGLAFLILLIWGLVYYIADQKDKAEVKRRQEAEDKAQADLKKEVKLHSSGEELHCLGCDTKFTGPLLDTGCPKCHTASLVITEAEYLDTLKTSL
jgi:Zn finger protein HypA/HybF involved in hydrogenase expression